MNICAKFIFLVICFSFLISCNPMGDNSFFENEFGARSFSATKEFSDDGTYKTPNYVTFNSTTNAFEIDPLSGETEFNDESDHAGTTVSSDLITIDESTATQNELSDSINPDTTNLVAHYKFNNALTDETGSFNGTAEGTGPTFVANARLGSHSAGSFSVANYASTSSFSDFSSTNNFTFMAWVKITSDGVTHTLASKQNHFILAIDSDDKPSITITESDGSTYTTQGPDLEMENWYHIAFILESSTKTIRIFVNGDQRANKVDEWDGTILSSTSGLEIGRNFAGTNALSGEMDEMVFWSSSLTTHNIRGLYLKQVSRLSGIYNSKIFDSEDEDSIMSVISFASTLPYGKEMSLSNEVSENYSALSTETLSDNIVAHYRMNGITDGVFTDSSTNELHGSCNNSTTASNDTCPNAGVVGRFSQGALFNGTRDFINIDSLINSLTGDFTLSFWVLVDNKTSDSTLFTISTAAGNDGLSIRVNNDGGVPTIDVNDAGVTDIDSNTNIGDGLWHHVALTLNDATDDFVLYIDGVKDASTPSLSINITPSLLVRLGNEADGSDFYKGKMDEMVVWNRLLSDAEVLEMYRRGANRVGIQFRSCTTATCSNNPTFVGPRGTGDYVYSEIFNNSSFSPFPNFGTSGTVTSTNLQTTISSFSSGAEIDPGRYYQFRVILESDDNQTACSGQTTTCLPDVNKIAVTPQAYVVNKKSIVVSNISSLSFVNTGDCAVEYQLQFESNTSTVAYVYDSTDATWERSRDLAQATSTKSEIETNISSLKSDVGITGGSLFIKSLLTGGMSCGVKSFSISGVD